MAAASGYLLWAALAAIVAVPVVRTRRLHKATCEYLSALEGLRLSDAAALMRFTTADRAMHAERRLLWVLGAIVVLLLIGGAVLRTGLHVVFTFGGLGRVLVYGGVGLLVAHLAGDVSGLRDRVDTLVYRAKRDMESAEDFLNQRGYPLGADPSDPDLDPDTANHLRCLPDAFRQREDGEFLAMHAHAALDSLNEGCSTGISLAAAWLGVGSGAVIWLVSWAGRRLFE